MDTGDGSVSRGDLIVVPPDYTPFGFMRRLMEENGVQKRKPFRRSTGWRLTQNPRRRKRVTPAKEIGADA